MPAQLNVPIMPPGAQLVLVSSCAGACMGHLCHALHYPGACRQCCAVALLICLMACLMLRALECICEACRLSRI